MKTVFCSIKKTLANFADYECDKKIRYWPRSGTVAAKMEHKATVAIVLMNVCCGGGSGCQIFLPGFIL